MSATPAMRKRCWEASPLQEAGVLRDIFAERVLGPCSFCYCIDPGRPGLMDAASEIRASCLRAGALVCSAWHGSAAATFEWERQRYADEKRLLFDPYIQPIVAGASLKACPRAQVFDASKDSSSKWLDPPRFAKMPFKEGDVLLVDVLALSKACEDLAEEQSDSPVFTELLRESRRLAGLKGKRIRCRATRFHVVSLPRHHNDTWFPARGPRGRVLVEIGTPVCPQSGAAEGFLEPSDPKRDAIFSEVPSVEALVPFSSEDSPIISQQQQQQQHKSARALAGVLTTKRSSADPHFAFSRPLPLLENGVLVRVVPACYRTPTLDWPSFNGAPLRLGSAFCAVGERRRVLLGYARELRDETTTGNLLTLPPPDPTNADSLRERRRIRHVLHVRDARDGTSATKEAAFFGLSDWHRGNLVVFERPLAPPFEPTQSPAAPANLAHLVLDCSRGSDSSDPFLRPVVGDTRNFATPRCLVCACHTCPDVKLACGCTPYCSWTHARIHQDEHDRWCHPNTVNN